MRLLPLGPLLLIALSGCQSKPPPGPPPLASPTWAPYTFPSNQPGAVPGFSGARRIAMGLRQLVGSTVMDCGSAGLHSPQRYGIDACGIAAFKKKIPFRLSYNVFNNAGEVIWCLAGNAEGELFFLTNTDGLDHIVTGERLHRCQHPIIVHMKGQPRLTCRDKPNLIP